MSGAASRALHFTSPGAPRFSWGLGSYFKLPDQGMKDYEVLSRGSLFLVPFKDNLNSSSYHLVSAAHITHPFRYLALYPNEREWLKYVTEPATLLKMQVRECTSGNLMKEFTLSSRTYVHPKLDLVVMHLVDEENFLSRISSVMSTDSREGVVDANSILRPLTLPSLNEFQSLVNSRDEIRLEGHDVNVSNSQTFNTNTDPSPHSPSHPFSPVVPTPVRYSSEEKQYCNTSSNVVKAPPTKSMIPASVRGRVLAYSHPRLFVETEIATPMGVCGGPVIGHHQGATKCLGMVESLIVRSSNTTIVPSEIEPFLGSTMAISAPVIDQFLEHVEAEYTSHTLKLSLFGGDYPLTQGETLNSPAPKEEDADTPSLSPNAPHFTDPIQSPRASPISPPKPKETSRLAESNAEFYNSLKKHRKNRIFDIEGLEKETNKSNCNTRSENNQKEEEEEEEERVERFVGIEVDVEERERQETIEEKIQKATGEFTPLTGKPFLEELKASQKPRSSVQQPVKGYSKTRYSQAFLDDL